MGYKISVRVYPNSKVEKLEYFEGEKLLKIWTTALPIEGKANQKVIELVAKYLKVPKTQVSIKTGLSTKNKIVEIEADISKIDLVKKPKLL